MSSPRFATAYLRVAEVADRHGGAQHRRLLVAGLTGTVCEIGCGQGRNFVHYPPDVEAVVGVEPEPILRDRALAEARHCATEIRVLSGHADALPVDDAAVDAVVLSLVLCTVPDLAGALREARRVLRPAGQLRFYEHVRSRHRLLALAQDAVAPVWARAAGGCRPNRDPVAAINRAGFRVIEQQRFGFNPWGGLPRVAHVIGRAVLAESG